jgi:hypothetical protein
MGSVALGEVPMSKLIPNGENESTETTEADIILRSGGWVLAVASPAEPGRFFESVARCWITREGMTRSYGHARDANTLIAVYAAVAEAVLKADAGHPWDGKTASEIIAPHIKM